MSSGGGQQAFEALASVLQRLNYSRDDKPLRLGMADIQRWEIGGSMVRSFDLRMVVGGLLVDCHFGGRITSTPLIHRIELVGDRGDANVNIMGTAW